MLANDKIEAKSKVLDFTEKSKYHKLLKEIKRDLVCIKALMQDRIDFGEEVYDYEIKSIIDFLEKKYMHL